ncbi:hypothetical protein L861_22495 [Litchfieldella anticariensis FP35 = DSM 16096]|uniref:Uncharacterized protein n=1 Tax=Litchfieldella anticariensis (strain DSM 16096 / CECT 5854 / CIP 108499 / LMG 22089 / FP35) TaxID=1121939 RepID=S2KLQ5_LITA3|nr:hypothetical protein L861_22495 [Halomonas anticariensis FP35 = DSM 16096]
MIYQWLHFTGPGRGDEENIAFYRSLGYVQDEVVSLGRRLIED